MSSSPVPNPLSSQSPRSRSRVFGRLGWFLAFGIGLVAAFLDSQNFALKTTVRLKQTEVELASIETQSVKQQIAAERILAARQIADLSRNKAQAGSLLLVLLRRPNESAAAPEAVVAWDPATQKGIFWSNALPAIAPNEEYWLWIDGNNGQQAGIGPLEIDPKQPTKADFTTALPVDVPVRFTLTRQRQGGPATRSDNVVLTGTP